MNQAVLNFNRNTQSVMKELKNYFGEKDEEVISTALAIAKVVVESAGEAKTCTIVGQNYSKVNLDLNR